MKEMLASLRAWKHLVWLTLRRQLFTRKNYVALALLGVMFALVLLMSFRRALEVDFFGERILAGPFGTFIFPMVLLAFGTAALGHERDDGTLVYLTTRPLGRWAIYLGKYLGIVPLGLLFGVGGMWGLCQIGGRFGGEPLILELFDRVQPGYLAGALAYLALFHLFAALFRHAILVSLAYVFSVELFVGAVPGIAKCLSISYYTSTVVYNEGERDFGIEPPDPLIHLPMETSTALVTLAVITIVLLVVGAVVFTRRDATRPED